MDEWTPTPEQSDIIMAFALQNVIEYDGNPQMGSTIGRLMGARPELRDFGRYVSGYVRDSMADAVNLYEQDGREASLEYLGTLGSYGVTMLDRFREM